MEDHKFTRLYCTRCGNHFDVPVNCKNRFCSVCSAGRRRRIRQKLTHVITSISPLPNYQCRFLTLTIPNSSKLKSAHETLVKSFRKLRQRQFWINKVAGGCYVIETTGRPGNWHVHLHAIIYSRFLPVRTLSKQWSKCSPGRIVHIKNIPLSALLNYVTKYVCKSTLSVTDQFAASKELSGSRLFQPFGTWQAYCESAPKFRYECPICHNTHFILERRIDNQFSKMPHLSGIPPSPT